MVLAEYSKRNVCYFRYSTQKKGQTWEKDLGVTHIEITVKTNKGG